MIVCVCALLCCSIVIDIIVHTHTFVVGWFGLQQLNAPAQHPTPNKTNKMRSSALGVVAIVVALAHIVGTHGQNACGYSPMPGVTFDLAPLEAADG